MHSTAKGDSPRLCPPEIPWNRLCRATGIAPCKGVGGKSLRWSLGVSLLPSLVQRFLQALHSVLADGYAELGNHGAHFFTHFFQFGGG